jgi:hypothetical protein
MPISKRKLNKYRKDALKTRINCLPDSKRKIQAEIILELTRELLDQELLKEAKKE